MMISAMRLKSKSVNGIKFYSNRNAINYQNLLAANFDAIIQKDLKYMHFFPPHKQFGAILMFFFFHDMKKSGKS